MTWTTSFSIDNQSSKKWKVPLRRAKKEVIKEGKDIKISGHRNHDSENLLNT